MRMVIGDDAREAIYQWVHQSTQDCSGLLEILNRCTDAPEVGGAEPVAFQYEYTDPVSGNSVWMTTPGPWNLQNPKSSRPLYAHPPEVGLPDGWVAVPVEPTPKMRMAGAPTMNNMGPEYAEACYRAMIAAAPKGLESAGQKEKHG